LLDYARTAKTQTEEVDLTAFIEQVTSELKTPNNIVVDLSLQPNVKSKTDSSYVKRIITNLWTNAIQAMSTGGTLTIVLTFLGNGVRIRVSDTGQGIPDEVKGKIFTPLFTTKAKGQGFGLAAVKKMVEELHGTITFESQHGKGTKFTIDLPIIQ
jgi:signal transduction histidine kinase